ncbi:MAG: hypothetical protein FLDDKLPJ_03312 [Phycisphaerae bacterium]|nr:hypothetical protein [Phycisphaerae bacterium]
MSNEARADSSERRRLHWARWVVGVSLLVVGGLLFFVYWKPRVQLVPRTGYYLSVAIEAFVRETGEMPTGITDLERHGLLAFENGETVLSMEEYPPALLRYLEAIDVNWGVNLASIDQRKCLIDLRSGSRISLIKRPWWCGGEYADGDLRVIEAYRSHFLHQEAPANKD